MRPDGQCKDCEKYDTKLCPNLIKAKVYGQIMKVHNCSHYLKKVDKDYASNLKTQKVLIDPLA